MGVVPRTDPPTSVPDETTVTYAYSATEYVTALEKLPHWRLLRVLQVGSVVLYGLMAVLVGLAAWLKREPLAAGELAGFVGLSVAWWFVFPGIRAAERYRYRRQTPDGTPQTRRFGPTGFSASPDGPLIPWGLISQVRETPEAFLISDASSMTWVSVSLPKRALTDAQLAEFRTTLELEFLSRPKQLKLLRDK